MSPLVLYPVLEATYTRPLLHPKRHTQPQIHASQFLKNGRKNHTLTQKLFTHKSCPQSCTVSTKGITCSCHFHEMSGKCTHDFSLVYIYGGCMHKRIQVYEWSCSFSCQINRTWRTGVAFVRLEPLAVSSDFGWGEFCRNHLHQSIIDRRWVNPIKSTWDFIFTKFYTCRLMKLVWVFSCPNQSETCCKVITCVKSIRKLISCVKSVMKLMTSYSWVKSGWV